MGDV
jgi:class 3 adenylate cyclase